MILFKQLVNCFTAKFGSKFLVQNEQTDYFQ